jgi:beta-glucosidase
VPSDWTRWSLRGQVPYIGLANDYWCQYRTYHQLVQDLGCNAFRISIEWARVEPRQNEFDHEAILHYREILIDLKNRGLTTVVGLWHWSMPVWFEDHYGMHHTKAPKLFEQYVDVLIRELGELIDVVIVLNEPHVFVSSGYIHKKRPPFFCDYTKAYRVTHNLVKIHKRTWHQWKEHFKEVRIGSTFLVNDESGATDSIIQNTYLCMKRYLSYAWWIKKTLKYSDYIGINYYTSDQIFFGKSGGKYGVHGTNDWHSLHVWKKFPAGLHRVLMRTKKYHKPVYVMENGKPTDHGVRDSDRQIFIAKTLSYVKKAIDDGVDVRGYFYYSLCDSYEWDSGYDFKFGLVQIDRDTSQLTQRASFDVYAQIIKKNDI